MLHTCKCGETWSADYIRRHMTQFELNDMREVTSCPDCGEFLPGLPGVTTNRSLAAVRVVRCSDEDWMIAGSTQHFPSVYAVLEAICLR